MTGKQYRIDQGYDPRDPHLRISIDSELRATNKDAAEEFDNICFQHQLVKAFPPHDVNNPPEYFMLSTADAPAHLRPLRTLDEALQKAGWKCKEKS